MCAISAAHLSFLFLGESCQYRHALPPGFVLKSSQKKDGSDEPKISLEEFLAQVTAIVPKLCQTSASLTEFVLVSPDEPLREAVKDAVNKMVQSGLVEDESVWRETRKRTRFVSMGRLQS